MFDEEFIMTSWYHHGKKKIQRFDSLECSCEPTNQHDPTAVKITKNGIKVGYIPEIYSASATSVLKSGGRLNVVVLADSMPKDNEPPMLRVYEDVLPEEPCRHDSDSNSESESGGLQFVLYVALSFSAFIAIAAMLSTCAG